MYLRYLPLLTLFVSVPALALSFQTPLEKIEWKVEGDKFECRMTQAVTDFGRGQFVQRAGERPIFRLEEHSRWFAGGSATLLAAAAPWQPGRGDINLGQVSVQPGSVPLSSNEEQGGRLLAGMLDGRSPLVRYRGQPSGESLEVRLLPVSINKPYNDFIACTANLLPVNFDQIRKSQLGFSGPGLELDPLAQAKLDIILDYVRADPSVNRFELDGHSDNSGNRLSNRDVSRRRAMAVQAYLIANGIPEEQIIMRFHGERYPLVANNSEANRARNRRVTIELFREPMPEPPAQAEPAAPAAPETVPPEAKAPAATS